MKKSLITIGGLFALVLGGGAFSFAAVMSPPLPQVQMYKGIPYLTGGVGLEEREILRHMAKADDLRLIFARKDGHYLSDVEVVITDAKGHRVLEALSQGPWFFTKLPAGKYTVTAGTLGTTRRQIADVTAKGQTQLYFYW